MQEKLEKGKVEDLMDNLCYVRSLSLLAAMERFKKSMGMTSRSSNSHVTPVHIWDQNFFVISFFFCIFNNNVF